MGVNGTPFGGEPTLDPLAQFLGRVLAWSADSYVNFHGFTPKAHTEARGTFARKGGGRAYSSLLELPAIQQYLFLLDNAGDEAFFCISTRSAHKGVDKQGNRKATRSKALNRPVQLKAFVLDLDVKPRGYPSQKAALLDVMPFLEKLGIDFGPIVDTGGGVHVYITLPEGVSPAIWQPLANALVAAAQAHGLKLDVAVTRDDDRILRVPGSWNRKQDPARPCRLLTLGKDTRLDVLRKALAGYSGIPISGSPKNGNGKIDLSFLPPLAPITRGPEFDRVRAERERLRVVTSFDLLSEACPVVADSDWRRGNGDREPLWFELAKLMHYVEDGRDYFHDLSDGDDRYDEQATDDKYDSVQTDGWPHCSTIAAASDEANAICRRCPHYSEGKSPIHFATRGDPPGEASSGQVNGHVNGTTLSAAPFVTAGGPPVTPIWVPKGYTLDRDNILWTPEKEMAFLTPILNFNVVYEDGRQLMEFTIDRSTIDPDPTGHFFIEGSTSPSRQKFAEAAATYGLRVNSQIKERVVQQDLLTQIQLSKIAQTYRRVGWTDSEEFIYGSCVHSKEGTRPTSSRQTDIGPRGSLAAWKAAISPFVGIGCTEMEVFIASAFAAPLIRFTTVPGGIVFTFSPGSGYGKSAAMEIAASVWYPRTYIIKVGTGNFALNRIATLNSLPAYFDELVPSAPMAKMFADLIKAVTSGSEPGRLKRTAAEMPQRFSCTILGANANQSLIDVSRVPDSDAQAARVLEFEMPATFKQRQRDIGDTALHREAMDANCGTAGAVFAEFIGKNPDLLREMVVEYMRYWQKRMHATDAERFWVSNAAAIMVGATIARKLDLMQFDLAAMREWIAGWFLRQRTDVADMGTNADDPQVQLQRVRDFLNDNVKSIIITDEMPGKGSGKQNVLNSYAILNSGQFVARFAKKDQRLWLSETALEMWCKHPLRGYSYPRMKSTLVKTHLCERHRSGRNIGAGTNHNTTKEVVLEFNNLECEAFNVAEMN